MGPAWQWLITLWQPLLLLMVANAAPIAARLLFGGRFAWPLDGGSRWFDGRPLLGESKTWRGLVGSLLATGLTASLIGLAWWLGALLALLAMTGDACASFIKRRLRIAPHGRAPVLDQLPEALLPLWLLQGELALGWAQLLLVATLFTLLDMILSPLLYRLHLRLRPY